MDLFRMKMEIDDKLHSLFTSCILPEDGILCKTLKPKVIKKGVVHMGSFLYGFKSQ